MVASSVMSLQEQSSLTRSNATTSTGNGLVPNPSGLGSVTASQLEEHFCSENGYTPKVRKPYTITKQRERWTGEEHKKFLEALKLYGRAWRRIEEHVSTKTAVQIRSHAQKFFTKVVRESSGNNANSDEPIEIPPPRSKRKPMHPYPRKLMHPPRKESLMVDQLLRSSSENLYDLEQENQSPTSVINTVHSDVLDSTDSNTPNRSLSPVSTNVGVQGPVQTVSELGSLAEDSRSMSSTLVTPTLGSEGRLLKIHNFILFFDEQAPSKDLSEKPSIQTLKLFGKSVVVTECTRPSSEYSRKPLPETRGTQDMQPLLHSMDRNWTSSNLMEGPLSTICYTQLESDNNNPGPAGANSTAAMPWWSFCGGIPFPIIPFHNKVPLEANNEVQDREIKKEGSWTRSTSGSVNERENVNKYTESEAQSRRNTQEDNNRRARRAKNWFQLMKNKTSAMCLSQVGR